LLEEDLFVPDIARALALNRSDLLIIFSKLSNRFSEIIKYLAIARAVENSIPVINIGGLLNIAGDEIINVKTFIVKSNGSIEGESDEDEEIFYMTVRLKDPARRGVKKIPGMEVSRNVIKYIRRNKLL
jgi:predicted amidohydrolase